MGEWQRQVRNSVEGIKCYYRALLGLAGDSDSKGSACNMGDPGSIPESRISPVKGMAAHSSILAWRIPWTEKPSGLWSMGLQRVRHV